MTSDTATSDTATATATAGTHAFQAEVGRILDLMVHAVYSDREVFLRELISNGADACEKLRYAARQDDSLLAGDTQLAVTLAPDAAAGTLTVSDNGIGMSREELAGNLGTIARSGTRAFAEALGNAGDTQPGTAESLIGRFGIGFYSAFMVADRVEVSSRRAGSPEGWKWSSDGRGTYTIEPDEQAPARGTRITLHLKEDAREFLEPQWLESIVAAHSAHVPVAIRLKEGEVSREIADGSALWLKPKAELTADDYRDFYRHVAGAWDEPALTIHYAAEGRQAYRVLLFVPSEKPFDLFDPDRKGRIRLYVRRVFITDDAELMPAYLRFVRGLVDSDDLPLNLSREMLQHSPMLAQIRKAVTNRVLSELARLAEKDPEAYLKVWSAFGPVLKEGLYEDLERRDSLLDLARFRSTVAPDGWRSLKDYVAGLRPNQTAIYYLTGDSPAQAAASPHLEGFRARGIEVLLLTDPVDHFWVRVAAGFDGKPFRSVSQGDTDIAAIPLVAPADDADDTAAPAAVATLAAFVRQTLGETVKDVRASDRLAESPVCLVAGAGTLDRRLERLLSRQDGAAVTRSAPILELNPRHPLIRHLAAQATAPGDKALLADAAWLLYDEACILDGETPSDPAAFAARLTRLLLARGAA
ncbi:molecular chaperone HtpG [Tepidamorphus gemmatus]|uniref:Chaperone protein HtpG n=1 Tax=Tepidamorphus gemmatus TaxID=747076 RepID=A0A4R3MED7_9HYPH|nr:molecular chaperone HtpG [Tepidamorphus gemmatus]TCT11851.1 molecular chaperone HtpG [Tepidamorphus gemmatus]